VLLGVNADDSQEQLRQAQARHGLTWRSCWDGDGAVARAWEVDRFPTLFLIDHQGRVRHQFVGAPDPAELARRVEELLGEAARS
jgi:peroxiredoxin